MCAALTDVRSMCDRLRRDETKVRYGRRCLWRCRASRDVPDARDATVRRRPARRFARPRPDPGPVRARVARGVAIPRGFVVVVRFDVCVFIDYCFRFFGLFRRQRPAFPAARRVTVTRHENRDTRSLVSISVSHVVLQLYILRLFIYTSRLDVASRFASRSAEREPEFTFFTDLARRRSARTPSYTRAGISSAVRPMPRHRSH